MALIQQISLIAVQGELDRIISLISEAVTGAENLETFDTDNLTTANLALLSGFSGGPATAAELTEVRARIATLRAWAAWMNTPNAGVGNKTPDKALRQIRRVI